MILQLRKNAQAFRKENSSNELSEFFKWRNEGRAQGLELAINEISQWYGQEYRYLQNTSCEKYEESRKR